MVGINTNVMALRAQRSLATNNSMVGKSVHRLATGLRINSSADDAAGYAISKRMDAQSAGLVQAERNSKDGISLLKTAEGSLQETSNILIRMKELATQSANGTNSASDRAAIDSEVNQLKQEIDRIANNANFNGLKLLDGTFTAQGFQVGVTATESISISIGGARGSDLGNYRLNEVNATANQGTASLATGSSSLPSANTIAAQTLSISGTLGSTTVAVAAGDSAYTIAQSINSAIGNHGVKASAETQAQIDSLSDAGTITLTLGSGGSTATISASVTTTDLSTLATEINKKTGTTGISATSSGGTLTLLQADGKDINIADFSHTTSDATIDVHALKTDGTENGAAVTLDASTSVADSTVVSGSVIFDSSESFSVTSDIAAASGSILNQAAGTAQTSSSELLSSVDVKTALTAKTAMRIIDSALQKINSDQADIGALQNRFDKTISNIQTANENIMAASSQIKDADYAKETTELTKSQILSQAATAMLAQANQSGQSVLSLLQ